ncbi:sugar phosphate nucleotidyltransferase [Anaeromyxobacter paludicola]|uniref:Nucleoside-diphosphate-sugar pyrophosphorylase n=1 Tax=Anaeromyxobacter paludicola TaxID=2918171 RepID=A0ABN6N1J5_9BACT|nr:sugar phosphate nucleotidyltransferase [Anaeromyxobacter paludicola]BDG07082.1 nucleoside-diphosphate-sugar pyrophosphorylase [Anaeromyxobacter paludicola]
MQAVILAGGKGTRLRPYTTTFPKPLMPLDDLPIVEIVLRQLAHHGFTDVIITTGHLAELIRLFCGDGSRWGLHIEYSLENEPLGTAGPLALLADRLEDHFLVMNGDLLTTMSYRRVYDAHVASGATASIGVYRREVKIDFGVIEEDEPGRLARYVEKPTFHFDVSMGINVLSRSALRFVEPGKRLDMPDLMARIVAAGERVSCYREPCYWLDIGRVDDFQVASEEFQKRRAEFLPHA